jgi:hypothetical protein
MRQGFQPLAQSRTNKRTLGIRRTQNQRNRVFAVFRRCIDILGKNPVSGHAYIPKKPGFSQHLRVYRYSRKKPGFSPPRDILAKNPVSRHTYNNLAITRPKQMSFTDNK